ncbi:MAG: hypothetical protein SGI94_21330 [Saprospiraceae bacterium]|nr:hypothetical protein [Saprospiraceae bacterium]
MQTHCSSTLRIGACLCLFLLLIPAQSKAVCAVGPPNLKKWDTISISPVLKDTIPETQQKIEEAYYQKYRKAAIALTITSAITGILGALLLAKGLASSFILTSSLLPIFGGVLLFAAGLTLVFGIINWIRARRVKKRLRKAGVR